ncbi:MAG TPA: hypothetical protein PLF54_03715 [Deltaproteobacteria bacterium]|jgi:hypothetical protein|nr:hypothetical protein [Deltaproteobacteria bacterium]HQJ08084.1 hypothetical protein [Deltaproteobacteria bacterium]
MRKVTIAFICMAVSTIFLSQTAEARTQATVSIGTPGFYLEASNMRPCPRTVCVVERHHWYGGHRVHAPGHWAYAPRHHRYAPAHRWDNGKHWRNDRFDRDHDRKHQGKDSGRNNGSRGDRAGSRR